MRLEVLEDLIQRAPTVQSGKIERLHITCIDPDMAGADGGVITDQRPRVLG